MQILQLSLEEEVKPDASKAQRSTTTGHLVITMPKAKSTILTAKPTNNPQMTNKKSTTEKTDNKTDSNKRETLEVDPSKHKMPDIGNIVKEKEIVPPLGAVSKRLVKERENSADFVDDPDVPPLI